MTKGTSPKELLNFQVVLDFFDRLVTCSNFIHDWYPEVFGGAKIAVLLQ